MSPKPGVRDTGNCAFEPRVWRLETEAVRGQAYTPARGLVPSGESFSKTWAKSSRGDANSPLEAGGLARFIFHPGLCLCKGLDRQLCQPVWSLRSAV